MVDFLFVWFFVLLCNMIGAARYRTSAGEQVFVAPIFVQIEDVIAPSLWLELGVAAHWEPSLAIDGFLTLMKADFE